MQKAPALIVLFLLTFITVYSQEYRYDGSGNLSSDANKVIASIHYNHLNLVDTIIYVDGRKIVYMYTGDGHKLREQSIKVDGTVNQKRDYVGSINYRNDTLREVQNEGGRVIPVNPGNDGSEMEYQYFLKDHLGSVRNTLTTRPVTDISTATNEPSNVTTEQSKFLGLDQARLVNTRLFDHTRTDGSITHYSQRLSGVPNEKIGLARSLSVMPGDLIKAKVYAKYPDVDKNNWNATLSNLMSLITAQTTGVVIDGINYLNTSTPLPASYGNLLARTDNGAPEAYLNCVVFDRNFQYMKSGFKQITTQAREPGTDVPHEEIALEDILITQPGFAYIWVSNESVTTQEVYFDDFTVTHVHGPIVQEADYYPFGLTFNEYQRENTTSTEFLYTGKEKQSDFNLNWEDFGARMYDPALGRWNGVDQMAEKYANMSPYNYALNDPMKFVDLDGRDLIIPYEVTLKNGDIQERTYRFRGGNPKGVPNDAFVRAVIKAYQYDVNNGKKAKNGGGENLKKLAESRVFSVTIVRATGSAVLPGGTEYDVDNNILSWNPAEALVFDNGAISPATILEHEAAHALYELSKKMLGIVINERTDASYETDEERRVITGAETATAIANGEIPAGTISRPDHSATKGSLITTDPTSNQGKEDEALKGFIEFLQNRSKAQQQNPNQPQN